MTKEPGGIVVLKLPIWSVTRSVGGFIPLLLTPRVKLELIENSDWFGYTVSRAVKALNGTPPGCMNLPKAMGKLPTVIVATTVLVAVAITETVLPTAMPLMAT